MPNLTELGVKVGALVLNNDLENPEPQVVVGFDDSANKALLYPRSGETTERTAHFDFEKGVLASYARRTDQPNHDNRVQSVEIWKGNFSIVGDSFNALTRFAFFYNLINGKDDGIRR